MKRLTLYPFFFGLFAALSLFVANRHEAHARELIVPAIVVVTSTLLLLGVAMLIVRDAHRAAMLVTAVVIWFFTYRHWTKIIWTLLPFSSPKYGLFNEGALSVVLGLTLVTVVFVASRRIKQTAAWTPILNRICGVLLVCPLAALVIQEASPRPAAAAAVEVPRDVEAAVMVKSIPAGMARPDIYFIVMDAHGRPDELRNVYGYDSSRFVRHLRDKGFFVADASTSNYCFTELSIGSALEMRYLDEFTGRWDFSLDPVNPVLRHNSLVATLKSLGYSWVSFESALDNMCFPNADVYYRAPDIGGITPFQEMMIDTTALSQLGGGILRTQLMTMHDAYHVKRRTILYELEHGPDAAKLAGPKFVLIHLMAPHIPFVFSADGSDPGKRGYGALTDPGITDAFTVQQYRDWYRDQVTFIDRSVSQMIDKIVANSATPPVIVVMGDHGPRSGMHWGDTKSSDLMECMANFTAVYLPGKGENGLYASISPVNLFRVVLNHCFDARLPMLQDRAYFSIHSPFIYADITDRVRKGTALAAGPDVGGR